MGINVGTVKAIKIIIVTAKAITIMVVIIVTVMIICNLLNFSLDGISNYQNFLKHLTKEQ